MNVFVAGTTAYLPTFPLSGSSLELREPAVTEGSLLESFLIEHRWFGQWLDGGSLRRALATARSNRGALSTSDLPFNKKNRINTCIISSPYRADCVRQAPALTACSIKATEKRIRSIRFNFSCSIC